MYGEDIDLCYRAARAGWERWYVPAARVTHDYAAVIDRRFLTRHTLVASARDGAVRAQASRAPASARLAPTSCQERDDSVTDTFAPASAAATTGGHIFPVTKWSRR